VEVDVSDVVDSVLVELCNVEDERVSDEVG
jgi:hypothetical protein